MGNKQTFSHFEAIINEERDKLLAHPIPLLMGSSLFLKKFMEVHIYAVWDFMSLLKSLQRTITQIELPWKPSSYSPNLVRFINEIVLGEECDLLDDGRVIDHFSLYLKAMEEIGANTRPIKNFLEDFKFGPLPKMVQKFLSFHLGLVNEGAPHKVAASFFYGREDIIPRMFSPMVEVLKRENKKAPLFHCYLERHIELDGDHHGPLAKELLSTLCGEDLTLWNEALEVGVQSLRIRMALWDHIVDSYKELNKSSQRNLSF